MKKSTAAPREHKPATKRFERATSPAAEPLEHHDVGADDELAPRGDQAAEESLADAFDALEDEQADADEYGDESYADDSTRSDAAADSADGPQRGSCVWATAMLAAGSLLALSGVALAVLAHTPLGEGVRALLEPSGVRPTDVILVGLVLAGAASVRRGLHRQEAELASAVDAAFSGSALSEELHAQLAELVSTTSERAPDAPAALHEILHLVKRQEEKIINLSKATKMYGKPLLEITNRISESSHQIGEMISTVNAVKVIVEQSSTRLESTLRAELAKSDGAAELKEVVRVTRDAVGRLEALQRELSQALASSSDRIAAEVRETSRDSQRAAAELKRELATTVKEQVEKLGKEMEQLDRRVEHARTAVVTGMKSLGEGRADAAVPADLSNALERMHGEIATLTGEIGALKATGVAARTKRADGDGDEAAAKAPPKAGGKSVHTAIAKLKQMRQ